MHKHTCTHMYCSWEFVYMCECVYLHIQVQGAGHVCPVPTHVYTEFVYKCKVCVHMCMLRRS